MVDSGHNMRNRERTMFNNMTTTSNIRIINFVPAKTFQHGWVSAGYSVIYQADLSVHEVLDLYRIHCIINHTFGKEALNFLQISASNGRDSVVFSLPDVTTDGSIIYESSRLLLPLLSGDITEGRNQTLTVKVQTRLLEDVYYNLRVVNYDRAQYNVSVIFIFIQWQWREIMYPGIYDVCFHNYACAHSLFGWVSFNHIISNMGYAINATLYLSFIKIRRNRGCQGYGTFGNYGLELCIALSLFCESFASAVYHICPNGTSYYFDTPFIHVICVLIMLKIYGNRRGTVSPQLTNLFIAFIFGMDITIPIFGRHSIFCGVLMIGHMIVVCAYLSKICVFRKVSIC
uniref:Rhomboid domain-containing protein n=1 Tax=Heterorhabditis bacteriophora TaxID=37862 RepID=A0A1I7XFD1_HETBA